MIAVDLRRYDVVTMTAQGQLWVWDGDSSETPTRPPIDSVTALSATARHACAAGISGGSSGVFCWGEHGRSYDEYYHLGGTPRRPAPRESGNFDYDLVRVPLAGTVRSLAVGDLTSCAVLADGGIWCWGELWKGEPGARSASQSAPVPVAALGNDNIEAAVISDVVCGRRIDGTVWCWGDPKLIPFEGALDARLVPLPGPARQIDAGGIALCALLDDGSVWCWGQEFETEAGGVRTIAATPRRINFPGCQ